MATPTVMASQIRQIISTSSVLTRLQPLASSSRCFSSTHFQPHQLPLTVSRTISSTRLFTSSSTRLGAAALAQPLEEQGSFEGIPAAAYNGPVEGVSVKGKERETTSSASSASTTAGSSTSAPAAAPRKREIRSKKAAISMTPAAITRLRALMASPTDPKLLRIGVKTRGCAGMAYHLDYVPPPGGRFDEVVEQDGVRVLIDSKALFSIIGSVMDWRDNRLSAGFVFDNPNVVDTCGCGESFNIQH